MDDQNKNLILATVLSFLVILGWFLIFPPPETQQAPQAPAAATEATTTAPAPTATATSEATEPAATETARLAIDTPRVSGSIALTGGRVDDLLLKDYRVTIDPNSPLVRLLTPVGEKESYYARYGWESDGTVASADLPGPNTVWTQTAGSTLTPDSPVTLSWDNGKGMVFTRTFAIDDNYMFTVTQGVTNNSGAPVTLYPYGVIDRHGVPSDTQNFFVLHEGVVRMADGQLEETRYKDVAKLPVIEAEGGPAEIIQVTQDGWIGFTGHYWQTILIPADGQPFTAVTKHLVESDIYRTTVRNQPVTIAPGASAENASRLFAGAKEWETLRYYQDEQGVHGFVDSIDWGWFYFLTKPIFRVLHALHGIIGNMGLAIMALTLVLKIIVLPLAWKSYASMARMKELQPEIEKLKERAGDDKAMMQRDMMALYKEKKVNPAAGCLPVLIQIPIFFSLYKVIFVTLELRHAPFFGWLKDLSAPDPSSLFNLFGLLPWAAPTHGTLLATVFIGVLPILLGISMWFQQKLNPAPADPAQAAIFAWMPWIFMFMLGGFASGLVLYWITNNTITFAQQYLIMRSHGSKPDFFGNIKASVKRKPKAANDAKAPKPDTKK
ncbi:membrane protein insertase YidC [Tabrizicola sp. J26]|uniref:membrane protein insertase YidC n=1 Tax=Alitabrizicola rongguiensis TaxID=2909234 RepID=UPI001F182CD6|nr:membrane protein insertase YidC [Tabrizicola rongguiensis]MCF1707572.1 membrane protein insertase YidC [Tabrizicola rongguiensis]